MSTKLFLSDLHSAAAGLLLRAGRRQRTPADAAALARLTSELFPQIRMLSQDAKRA